MMESSNEEDQNVPLCKKFKKIKYEIEMQNYKINKLQRELEMKKELKGISPFSLEKTERELKSELCTLGEMIQLAMEKQSLNKEENCLWNSISVNKSFDKKNKVLLNPPKTPSDISKISGIEELAYKEMLLSDNDGLEKERYKLQECVFEKDQSICNLNSQIDTLQRQMMKLTKANHKMTQKVDNPKGNKQTDVVKLRSELQHYTNVADNLSQNINRMDSYLQQLRNEFNGLKDNKQASKETHVRHEIETPLNETQNNKIQDLQIQYSSFLNEYCEKEKEHKKIADQLKLCKKNNEENGLEKIETTVLRKESERLLAEINDYKVLIKELQSQIELYRDKFIKAQEKVERQKIQLKKLDKSKNNIECQVNAEIEKIKEKFQEKLNELCPFPQKYEESRKEVQKSQSRIEILEKELKDTSSALFNAKCELKNLKDKPRDSSFEKHEKLQTELDEMQTRYCGMKKTKECLEEKLCSMKGELEDLRKDSAKIITTTKCCAEKNRQILHEQINCLELDLAQCRASASLSLTEKEDLIKQLKQELSTLCEHFNNCQDQIKELKHKINDLTERRYKDSNKIDCYQIFSNS